jgi:hypothetical protein
MHCRSSFLETEARQRSFTGAALYIIGKLNKMQSLAFTAGILKMLHYKVKNIYLTEHGKNFNIWHSLYPYLMILHVCSIVKT